MTKPVAIITGSGIRVNLRAVADTVLFLANDKEGHLHGQVIRIPSGIAT